MSEDWLDSSTATVYCSITTLVAIIIAFFWEIWIKKLKYGWKEM